MPYRGYPDEDDVQHYQHPKYSRSEPLCRNGSYHLKIISIKKLVTCEVCKQEMKKYHD